MCGDTAAIQRLLAADPAAALAAARRNGYLALHWAVEHGHPAANQVLLEAAPEAASQPMTAVCCHCTWQLNMATQQQSSYSWLLCHKLLHQLMNSVTWCTGQL